MTWILEPRIHACHQTKQGLCRMTKSRQGYSLCKVRNTLTTRKLQCMMPSCQLASERHQITVRTKGRRTRRAHVFPSASGHSTHCWACTQCGNRHKGDPPTTPSATEKLTKDTTFNFTVTVQRLKHKLADRHDRSKFVPSPSCCWMLGSCFTKLLAPDFWLW